MTDLLNKLYAAGYPRNDVFHWGMDLYVFRTDLTTRVVNEWIKENNVNRSLFVSVFRDNVTGKPMYECAFCYHD